MGKNWAPKFGGKTGVQRQRISIDIGCKIISQENLPLKTNTVESMSEHVAH